MSVLLAVALGCLGDPTGPRGRLLVQTLQLAADSILRGAPGRPLPQAVTFLALDDARRPISGAPIRWTPVGYGSRVEDASAVTGTDGSFGAVWVLGTRASELQRLTAEVGPPEDQTLIEVRARAVPVEVAAIAVAAETTAVLVGAPRVMPVVATDPYGNRFVPLQAHFVSLDTTLVVIDSLGRLHGRQAGLAGVQVAASGFVDTGTVRVIQVVGSIGVDHDTLRFRSLQQIDSLKVWVVDDQGVPIRGLLPTMALMDSSIGRLRAGSPVKVTSLRNGATTIQLQAANVVRQVAIVVQQQAATIAATAAYQTGILIAPIGALVPVVCRVLDANGYSMALEATVTTSGSGVVAGSHCSDVRVQRSGLDTLHLATGTTTATLPVAVAVPPVVSPALGEPLQADWLPPGEPWAPTIRRNSRGQLEVYFGVHVIAETGDNEDLHRLVSDDSTHFRYDGVVLQHDSLAVGDCSLTGFGFENLTVVPRPDAPGWRMFVAGGSFACYGWQVFSAVSTDERNWTLEPGIRLANGSDSAMTAPYWPTGEGIVVDRLPSGGWRMLNGAYEHVTPDAGRFQIIEWDSPDQLIWTYKGPALTTREMPAESNGNVYSPTIQQVAPGLWRMIFTGDNRWDTGGRSRLWSAVSTDREHWQVEGQLIGSDNSNFYYASMEGNRLVFIRRDDGGQGILAIATVSMP